MLCCAAERWGPWFLLALFGGILVWEEVWKLNNTSYLSAWLLLLITAGAMICSYVFERRLWCRYLCPIGGMNGLFAKLSFTELRARQGVCSGVGRWSGTSLRGGARTCLSVWLAGWLAGTRRRGGARACVCVRTRV
jgi:polyferredoxin